MIENKKITFLFGQGNWLEAYCDEIVAELSKKNDVNVTFKHEDLNDGDVAFFLGYPRIIPTDFLNKNTKNYVIHASDLPKGRGMSPWVWDVLNGAKKLHLCLLEAAEGLDEGNIIYKDEIALEGTELVDNLRDLIGLQSVKMLARFFNEPHFPPVGIPQDGETSYHPRRRPNDSEIDITKSLDSQFNLLRVVDNNAYPAFFKKNGVKYILKIEKSDERS